MYNFRVTCFQSERCGKIWRELFPTDPEYSALHFTKSTRGDESNGERKEDRGEVQKIKASQAEKGRGWIVCRGANSVLAIKHGGDYCVQEFA